MILTFYSFKGGVGRSMALAHVADLLARRGLKVLAIDFDLEAPGLERYFAIDYAAARRNAGVIDLLLSFKRELAGRVDEGDDPGFRDLQHFLFPVYPARREGGSLYLLPAGRRESPAQMRRYALEVRTFDWQDFQFNWEGEAFFEWLRQAVTGGEHGFDVVLVDSRTGVTEMGGICAYRLSDAVVMLCAANHQNISGTRSVADDFTSPQVLALRRHRPLDLVVVPARIEQRDEALLSDFNQRFNEVFKKDEPEAFRRIGLSFTDLALPYEFAYAFEERVAASEMRDRRRPIEVAFERLADALTLLAKAGNLASQAEGARTRLLGAASPDQAPPAEQVYAYDPASRFAGYDAFLSYPGAEDAHIAHLLADALRARGLTVFFAETDLPSGQALPETLSEALRHSRHLLLCASRSGISEWQKKEVAFVRDSGRPVRIVPLLLQGAEADIFSLTLRGAADLQTFDLRDWPGQDAAFELLVATLSVPQAEQAAASAPPEAATLPPYPGLRFYGEEHEADFFGREQEIEQLMNRLADAPIATVQGASGIGKTSLVMAGIFPRLRRDALPGSGTWELARVAVGTEGWDATLRRFLADTDGRLRLLFIDQLDELGQASQLARFGDLLEQAIAAAAHPDGGLRLIFGWRKTLPKWFPTYLPRLAGALDADPIRLELPNAARRRAAIEKPAARRGRILEPGLSERLLSDAGEEASAFVVLQMVLPMLWDSQQRGWLANASYDMFGGISGVFSNHVEATYAALPAEEQSMAKALLLRLLAAENRPGTFRTRPAMWEQVCTQPDLAEHGPRVLATLTEARVVVVDYDAKAGEVRITLGYRMHAAPWPRLLDWIRDEQRLLKWREVLETNLVEWKAKGFDKGALLFGALLAEARFMGERYSRQLTEDERHYIDSSSAYEVHLLKRRRKIAGSALVIFSAMGLALWLNQNRLSNTVLVAQRPALESTADLLADASRRLDSLPAGDKVQAAQVLSSVRLQLSKADLSSEAAGLIASTDQKIKAAIERGDLQLAKSAIDEAQTQLSKEAPARGETRVYVQYTDEADSSLVDAVSSAIRKRWTVEPRELIGESTCGDVRFFYSADKKIAEQLRQDLAAALGERGITLEPRLLDLSGRFSGVRPGTLEIWLPPLGDLKVQASYRKNNADQADMHLVSAGCFISGSLRSERLNLLKRIGAAPVRFYDEEKPEREIWQGAFYMYRYEVTNAQFERFRAAACGPGRPYKCPEWKPRNGSRYPAQFVSWKSADAYCHWAGGRLPTEEEWEKAARGEDGRNWPWGDLPDPTRFQGKETSSGKLAPVGSHRPDGNSPYGLSDMAGNLWEMTASRWDQDSHTMKGGSYLNTLAESRASVRWASSKEAEGADYLGFRCVHPIAAAGHNEAPKAGESAQ